MFPQFYFALTVPPVWLQSGLGVLGGLHSYSPWIFLCSYRCHITVVRIPFTSPVWYLLVPGAHFFLFYSLILVVHSIFHSHLYSVS